VCPILYIIVSCRCCADNHPPLEGEFAIGRAKEGCGPYKPVVGILPNGDEVPGKLNTGPWGVAFTCCKALCPVNGGAIATYRYKRIEGYITS
jgi:hypothetical protein